MGVPGIMDPRCQNAPRIRRRCDPDSRSDIRNITRCLEEDYRGVTLSAEKLVDIWSRTNRTSDHTGRWGSRRELIEELPIDHLIPALEMTCAIGTEFSDQLS